MGGVETLIVVVSWVEVYVGHLIMAGKRGAGGVLWDLVLNLWNLH